MAIHVAVTEQEYQKAHGTFTRAAKQGFDCRSVPSEESALAGVLRGSGIQHVVVGIQSYRGALYQALSRGGVIARFGVGHDGIDKGLATEHGLLCTNTPGVLDDSVAEHTIGLLLALARHIAAQTARLMSGDWSPQLGVELAGKRLAVIGCGGIGRRVARIAARGFGMRVTGLRRTETASQDLLAAFGVDRIVTDFAEAVQGADVVSLHLPGGPETRHYLNRDRLAQVPPGCLLINTARGAVVDELALFDALTQGPVAGAALDVFEKEPYQPQDPDKDLRRLSNVVLTPHTGSSTHEACERMAKRALHNIELAVTGRTAEMDLLNPAVLGSLNRGAFAPRAAGSTDAPGKP